MEWRESAAAVQQHVHVPTSAAAWGLSTAGLRERLKKNRRALGAQVAPIADARPALKTMVHAELGRCAAGAACGRLNATRTQPTAAWLDILSDDEDDAMTLLEPPLPPPPLAAEAQTCEAAPPREPVQGAGEWAQARGEGDAAETCTWRAWDVCAQAVSEEWPHTGVSPIPCSRPSVLLDSASSSVADMAMEVMTEELRHLQHASTPQSERAVRSSEGGVDAACSPRACTMRSQHTQTRWKADIERSEARDRRELSMRQLRDREVALQAEVAAAKAQVESLRRSEQLSRRSRDEALRKNKELAEQLLQARRDLEAAQSSPAEHATGERSERAGDGAAEAGGRGKEGLLLARAGWRREAAETSKKMASQLRQERDKCEALEREVQRLRADAACARRSSVALQHTVAELRSLLPAAAAEGGTPAVAAPRSHAQRARRAASGGGAARSTGSVSCARADGHVPARRKPAKAVAPRRKRAGAAPTQAAAVPVGGRVVKSARWRARKRPADTDAEGVLKGGLAGGDMGSSSSGSSDASDGTPRQLERYVTRAGAGKAWQHAARDLGFSRQRAAGARADAGGNGWASAGSSESESDSGCEGYHGDLALAARCFSQAPRGGEGGGGLRAASREDRAGATQATQVHAVCACDFKSQSVQVGGDSGGSAGGMDDEVHCHDVDRLGAGVGAAEARAQLTSRSSAAASGREPTARYLHELVHVDSIPRQAQAWCVEHGKRADLEHHALCDVEPLQHVAAAGLQRSGSLTVSDGSRGVAEATATSDDAVLGDDGQELPEYHTEQLELLELAQGHRGNPESPPGTVDWHAASRIGVMKQPGLASSCGLLERLPLRHHHLCNVGGVPDAGKLEEELYARVQSEGYARERQRLRERSRSPAMTAKMTPLAADGGMGGAGDTTMRMWAEVSEV